MNYPEPETYRVKPNRVSVSSHHENHGHAGPWPVKVHLTNKQDRKSKQKQDGEKIRIKKPSAAIFPF